MTEVLNVPIALRRTPRHSTGVTTVADVLSSHIPASTMNCSRTPSKPRNRKRVRFSDPGPEINHSSPSATGLTPMVRRSSLGSTPSPKRKRHSTSARPQAHGQEDELAGTGGTPSSNEIRFIPLRQILDDRVKRRIRRNGLSEEMNIIKQEKKLRAQKNEEELRRLREELAEKDDEIERLRDSTTFQDTDRIIDLEQQVEDLRNKLRNGPDTADETHYDWTLAARDPFSDSYMGDEGFGDATVAELVCSTPSRGRTSFPTPPTTSPTMPTTPFSLRHQPSTPSSSHAGVQARLPDPEKEALEAELGSLHLELTKLTDTLESHEALKSRIAEKLAVAQSSELTERPDVEAHLDIILQTLSDRTAALLDLNSSLSSLGFPGDDASDIVSSLAATFRSARLELEYLTPGEITLPLSSHGAEVLDLVLARLRDLARKVKEDEDEIDEYHALELSLRQQLNTRVEVMDGLNRELKRGAARLKEKDERISELEVGVDRLKGAVEGYRRDISELENLVQRMDDNGKEKETQHRSEVDASRQEALRKDKSVAELESRLASVLSQTGELRIQIADIQAKKSAEIWTLNKSHGNALALRDARVTELRVEIDSINASLRTAHETIRQLRVENSGLKGSIESEKKKAKDAIDSMKAELERVLKMSEGILATPKKGAPNPRRSSGVEKTPGADLGTGTYLSGDLARTANGKKRRRYDSGLGFLDEEELDF